MVQNANCRPVVYDYQSKPTGRPEHRKETFCVLYDHTLFDAA